MKKYILFALIAFMPSLSAAKPYFRIATPFEEIKSGAFFAPGASQNEIRIGLMTPVIYHDSDDGYLFVEGVDWDLLDVGWVMATESMRGTLVFGPSLNIEEPIKKLLLKGVDKLPGGGKAGSYGALRSVLKSEGDASKAYLALGASFGLETASTLGQFKGHLLLFSTFNKKF